MKSFLLSIGAILLLLELGGCRRNPSSMEEYQTVLYAPQYASLFEIVGAPHHQSTLLKVKNPWQGAKDVEMLLFIARNDEKPPRGFQGQVLEGNASHLVCMSSSHVAILDALHETEKIVGVSGVQFITNAYVSSHPEIREVGYDGNMNYEQLLALRTDLVLLYGVNEASSVADKLENLGIPYVYIGEYLEESPLGKAEWMVAIAEIIGCRAQGETVFNEIPVRYLALREKAESALSPRPKVMINTPYGDSWFMPSTSSYMVRLIQDAGGQYLYDQNHTNESLPIDLEEATLLATQADVWIHTGNAQTLSDFKQQLPTFADMPCVSAGKLFNCDKRSLPSGGNDFWESGIVHPDLILRDLIKIFHPELIEEELTYYRQVP